MRGRTGVAAAATGPKRATLRRLGRCPLIPSAEPRGARPATKLLIAEEPLPEVDETHPARMTGIVMMTHATGRERKLSEHRTYSTLRAGGPPGCLIQERE